MTLFIVLAGIFLLWLAQRAQQQTGLPVGEVIYSDTGAWQKVAEPLISRRYGLVGKPDYLVQVTESRKTVPIPVEVKSRKRPAVVFANHTLQLATYCLLVEEKFNVTPPYGLLHYADATLKIAFTAQLRQQVIDAAEAIRRARRAADLPRNHQEVKRCHHCGYRQACGGQALVKEGT